MAAVDIYFTVLCLLNYVCKVILLIYRNIVVSCHKDSVTAPGMAGYKSNKWIDLISIR